MVYQLSYFCVSSGTVGSYSYLPDVLPAELSLIKYNHIDHFDAAMAQITVRRLPKYPHLLRHYSTVYIPTHGLPLVGT